MSPEYLQITTTAARAAPGVVRVHLAGDVDDATAPALRDALTRIIATQPAPLRLELDLAQVGHFSCSGVTTLLAAQHAVGGALTVVDANRAVHRMLEVLNLQPVLGPAHAHGGAARTT